MLERHEGIKHGNCHGGAIDDYFADSVHLMNALNASLVRKLFPAFIGRKLTAEDIRDAFDLAFGASAGAGERVKVSCVQDDSRRLIREITIGLSGELTPDADLATLIFAATPTDAGCPKGIVDRVGLQ